MKIKKNGFSLIELSIVILIISTVSVAALTIFSKKNIAEKNRETRAKLETIAEALKIYYKRNAILPCPALLTPAPDTAGFGAEDAPMGCLSTVNVTDNGAQIVYGAVPILSLGLPPEYLFDSWGNRIVYVLDRRFHDVGFPPTYYNGTAPDMGIEVIDKLSGLRLSQRKALRTEIAPAPATITDCLGGSTIGISYSTFIPDCPPMVLMSHGSNGLHSYNKNGAGPKEDTFGISASESGNASRGRGSYTTDNVLIDGEINQDMKDSSFTNYFDDILVYKSISYFTAD